MDDSGIDLPDDRPLSGRFDGNDAATCRPNALHYAPLDHDGVRARAARIVNWIAQAKPSLMVVDVSAEVAMLARLASVPTVYVRLGGERSDPAHLEAFRGASAILAPFHAALETDGTPDWVREKTFYVPGIASLPACEETVADRILVVFGQGGRPGDGTLIAEAARACPHWQWRVIGPAVAPIDCPANLEFAGWVVRPEIEIARARIIVGGAGNGVVGAVMAADKPFICLPEDRPFQEQAATGRGLKSWGAALVLPEWPAGRFWPRLFEDVLDMPAAPRRALYDPQAAQKVAAWLGQHADISIKRAKVAA
ncbi:glycosyltransferase [Novosphingobium sp. 9]|uniref:glycosyltransferase n=1 Tax=Novosphingobium sp. 9 TaxID=2025349 RepID=UPI0021B4F718|nr:glycosyltransferase [Novosphingobium sp. 9]